MHMATNRVRVIDIYCLVDYYWYGQLPQRQLGSCQNAFNNTLRKKCKT